MSNLGVKGHISDFTAESTPDLETVGTGLEILGYTIYIFPLPHLKRLDFQYFPTGRHQCKLL